MRPHRPGLRWTALLLGLWPASGLANQPSPTSQAVDAGGEDAGNSLRDLSKVRQLLDNFLGAEAGLLLQQARAQLLRGQLLSALDLLLEAHELAPGSVDVLLELGRLQTRLGHTAEAWTMLQRALELGPERVDVVLAVVDQVLREGVDAMQLEDLAQRLAGLRQANPDDPELIRRQARLAARLEHTTDAVGLYREALALAAEDETLLLELGDLQRDRGGLELALDWYRQVDAKGPFGDAARDRMWQVEVELQARRFGWSAGASTPPAAAAQLVARGRTLLERKRPREAAPLLEQALAQAPGYSEARLLLGDAWRVQGERQRAELEYLRGLVFDQASADLHARLGELYLEHVDGNRVQEAIALLGRALQLRPDWIELKLKLAQSLRRSGQLPRAMHLVQEYLAAQPSEPGRTQAQALLASLEKTLSNTGELTASTSPAEGSAEGLRSAVSDSLQGLNRARVLLERGQTAEALATLRQQAASTPDPRLRALEGRILHAAGQLDEAVAALEDSLRLAPAQADLHTQRGAILMQQGQLEKSEQAFNIAKLLGDSEAAIYLGELQLLRIRSCQPWTSWLHLPSLFGARASLDTEDQADDSPATVQRRLQLRQQLASAAWASALIPLLLLSLLLGSGGWWLRHRLGGVDLAQLLMRAPDRSAEVQRILASIHHEVLKHNTMILSGVVEALRLGQETEQQLERVRQLASSAQDGPYARFSKYIKQLETLASAAGQHLNLRFKDQAISPVYKGFKLLAAASGGLTAGRLARPRPRLKARSALEQAAVALNTEAYVRMKVLIDGIHAAPIDAAWIHQVFTRATQEPALSGVPIETLALSSEVDWPLQLSMARDSLADLLMNLFRNAIKASANEGVLPVKVGLHVGCELHAITGHTRLALAFRDQARASFTVQQAAAQPRDRGLGLVHELLMKNGGGLVVRSLTGDWSKEIVAYLPYHSVNFTSNECRT